MVLFILGEKKKKKVYLTLPRSQHLASATAREEADFKDIKYKEFVRK